MSMTAADNRAPRPRPACAICGASRCLNRLFCRVCRRADAKYAAERQHESVSVQRARQLLDNSVPLERAWAELNQRRRDGASQPTVEALMLSLRSRGVQAL